MLGCSVEDSTTAATTTACDAPTPRAVAPAGAVTGGLVELRENDLVARADCDPPAVYDVVLYPTDPYADISALRTKLATDSQANAPGGKKMQSYNVIEAPAAGFTAFIYLTKVQADYVMSDLNGKFGVSEISPWPPSMDADKKMQLAPPLNVPVPVPPNGWTPSKRGAEGVADDDDNDRHNVHNDTDMDLTPYSNHSDASEHSLERRLGAQEGFKSWGASQLSVPPRINWRDLANGYIDPVAKAFRYLRHESECEGQFVSPAPCSAISNYVLTLTFQVYIIEQDVDVNHGVRTSAELPTYVHSDA
jgi:hypothetical protein